MAAVTICSDLGAPKNKVWHCFQDQMPWSSFSECWALSQLFHSPLSLSSRGFLVPQLCTTLCNPMDCSTPGFLVFHYLLELAQTHVHRVGDASNHLILCRPLLLPPSIFLSIRVFSSKSVLRIRWPKYWSFSFSISPSNEYSGSISFRIDRLDVLAVKGTLKIFSNTTIQKYRFFGAQLSS